MAEDFTTNPGYQLAAALQALWRENENFAQLRADHKASVEGLQSEIDRLKQDILTGQKQLPLEPIVLDDAFAKKVQEAMHEAGHTDCTVTIPRILDAEPQDEVSL